MPEIECSQTVEDAANVYVIHMVGNKMDRLSEIEAFPAVVETGGFTAAGLRI